MPQHRAIDTPGTMARREPGPVDPMIYHRLFSTPDGMLVLEELERIFSAGAVLEGENAAFKTYHRAGKREVVEFIIRKLNAAAGIIPEEN